MNAQHPAQRMAVRLYFAALAADQDFGAALVEAYGPRTAHSHRYNHRHPGHPKVAHAKLVKVAADDAQALVSDLLRLLEAAMVARVCSWCKAHMGFKPCAPGQAADTTHGICPTCASRFRSERAALRAQSTDETRTP